jgi:hypothetical protein
MTIYYREQIRETLKRPAVAAFLERRTGLCIGGCGTVIPASEDTDLMIFINTALKHPDDNYIRAAVPESRPLNPKHDVKRRCPYRDEAFAAWIGNGPRYSESICSIYEVMTANKLVKGDDGWTLIERRK